MKFSIILGAILLILALILLISPAVRLQYGDKVAVTLRILFVKIPLLSDKPKKKKKDKPRKKSGEDVKKKVENDVKKQGAYDTFVKYKSVVTPVFSDLGTFVHHLRIHPLKMRIILAGSDAADLAVDYGRLCSVFYPTLAAVCANTKVGKKDIYIAVDYQKPKAEITADITVKVRVIFLVSLALKFIKHLVTLKLKTNIPSTNNPERNE